MKKYFNIKFELNNSLNEDMQRDRINTNRQMI